MNIKYKNETIITTWIKKFNRNRYENVMCFLACGVFLVPVLKLIMALVFNYWNELIWVQLIQLEGVIAILAVVAYLAYLKVNGRLKESVMMFIKENKWIVFMGIFVLWMFLSFFVNKCYKEYIDFANAIYGTTLRNEGILLRTMEVFILIGMTVVADHRKKRKVIAVILISSVLLTIPVIAQKSEFFAELTGLANNKAYLYMTEAGKYNSIFSHVNHYGYYLSMILLLAAGMFVFSKTIKAHILYGTMFILSTAILVVNNTFGGWLAAFISIIVMTMFFTVAAENKKTIFAKMIGVFVAFSLVSTIVSYGGDSVWKQMLGVGSDMESVVLEEEKAEEAGSGRWGVWVIAGEYIAQHPMFGGCEDCLVPIYKHADYKTLTRPANEYLQYAAFFGIPALMCYIITLIMILVNRSKNIKKLPPTVLIIGGAVVAYAISAFFGNTTIYTTMDFFVLLGLTAGGNMNI